MLSDFSGLRIESHLRKNCVAALLALLLSSVLPLSACSAKTLGSTVPEAKAIQAEQLWLAKVKNSTALPLFLP